MSDDAERHVALGSGGEFDAIRRMLRVWDYRAVGIGNDAALLAVLPGKWIVASTDASVEGVHFRREWLSPREIGGRAAAAALSDLAAMAAEPVGILLALGVPQRWRAELDELALGVGDLAEFADCPIVGGNITQASELSLTITVIGATESPLQRGGARAGDRLYVTGALGGPGAALDALLRGETPRAEDRVRFAAPRPRLEEARWLADRGARAAIDVSDGLASDAGHLAAASGIRIMLDLASIPCVAGVSPERAAASGEEYELLVAFPPEMPPDEAAFQERFGLALTAIGRAEDGEGVYDVRSGARVEFPTGHDHFS